MCLVWNVCRSQEIKKGLFGGRKKKDLKGEKIEEHRCYDRENEKNRVEGLSREGKEGNC